MQVARDWDTPFLCLCHTLPLRWLLRIAGYRVNASKAKPLRVHLLTGSLWPRALTVAA